MKTTEWFPADVDPVHVGVYQRVFASGVPRYCLWDGEYWRGFEFTVQDAAKAAATSVPGFPWRGLTEKAG